MASLPWQQISAPSGLQAPHTAAPATCTAALAASSLGKLVQNSHGSDTRPGVHTPVVKLTSCPLPAVEGLMYFAPACCAWLLIGVSVAEWPDMQATRAWTLVASKPFHFALAAVLGFAVNSLTYAVVILASSITLKVSGSNVLGSDSALKPGADSVSGCAVKALMLASTNMSCLQVASTIKGAIVVCVGMVFLHEVVTPLQASPQLLCMTCLPAVSHPAALAGCRIHSIFGGLWMVQSDQKSANNSSQQSRKPPSSKGGLN